MSELPQLQLERVTRAERPALDAMIDDYLPELARHREVDAGPVDAASYQYLPLYWTEPGRHPFFLIAQGERVGFVLVREVTAEGRIEMSEFYLLPERRRSGLGRAAASEVWRRFPGSWRLEVHPLNEAAAAFWPRCIEDHATGPVDAREVMTEDGCHIQYEFDVGTERTSP